MSLNDIWEYGTGATGIESQLLQEDISIFPNPCNGVFSLQFPVSKMAAEIKIFNSTGELIYHTIEGNKIHKVDLSFATNGIYFVKISLENQSVFNMRIVILK